MEKFISQNIYAAVDLGSNSFHLLVSRLENEELHVIDRHKEMVRLAGGLDKNKNLGSEAQQRALDCLQRMGHRLRHIPPENRRVVGTSTLRKARNARSFLEKAEAELGCDIDIISGREEARLLYTGVAHSLPTGEGKRLVSDIGGGSTELIIGEDFEPGVRESLHMGCVSMTGSYFKSGKITAKAWKKAVTHARLEFNAVVGEFKKTGWESMYGASGTFRSIESVLLANGWSHNGITSEGLKKLKQAIIEAKTIDKLSLPGLSDRRRPVFAGGAAIVFALFKTFKLETAGVAAGALREGVVYDLAGKQHHDDIRERTITHLAPRFNVDTRQAELVVNKVNSLYGVIDSSFRKSTEKHFDLLVWAARLHEIGLCISHAQYHKHGAYILEYADMPGFSLQEQDELSFLIRSQRRKYPAEILAQLRDKQQKRLLPLSILLRLVLLFSRNRTDSNVEVQSLTWNDSKKIVYLEMSHQWLDERPLYLADLYQEQNYLQKAGVTLEFN